MPAQANAARRIAAAARFMVASSSRGTNCARSYIEALVPRVCPAPKDALSRRNQDRFGGHGLGRVSSLPAYGGSLDPAPEAA
jgi:hypothetical protein